MYFLFEPYSSQSTVSSVRYKKSMQTSKRNLYVDISLRDTHYSCLVLKILTNHPPILFFLVRTTTF